jgi:rhodanese-related sulfurtransferase
MATDVKQLIDAANAAVPRITPAEAREMIAKGNTLVVDVRDAPELEKSGKVAGAVHHSRGMLEFRAVSLLRQEVRNGPDHHRLLRFRRALCAGR